MFLWTRVKEKLHGKNLIFVKTALKVSHFPLKHLTEETSIQLHCGSILGKQLKPQSAPCMH